MKNDFETALAFTLKFEGGFVNNRHDPGGATNRGITLKELEAFRGRACTVRDIMLLSLAEAMTIYRQEYWDKIRGDYLSPGEAVIKFDIAVNMGVGRSMQFGVGLGHLTPIGRIKAFDAKRVIFWRHLKIFNVFGRGWLAREKACYSLAMKLETAIKRENSAKAPLQLHAA